MLTSWRNKVKPVWICLLAAGLLAACSNGQIASSGGKTDGNAQQGGTQQSAAQPSAPQVSNEPVELLLYSNPAIEDDYMEDVFIKPLKAKHPNITLKYVQRSGGPTVAEQVATGKIPDLMIGSITNLFEFKDLGMFTDITPLIKKFNFDVNRVDPALMSMMKQYSDKGEIYGIPYKSNYNALFYNKDLFDKFGVPYPKDDMMWDDVVDLAKKVTRNADGIQYLGLDPENINRLAWGYNLGFVDAKTAKPMIDSWKPAFELLQKIIQIPGNASEKPQRNGDKDAFIKDMKLAMIATTNLVDKLEGAKLNWDIATYPQYPQTKGSFGMAGGQPILISSQSKYKDQAFQVIETVMSDEVQTKLNRVGKVTALSTLDVKKLYAADLPYAKGKNLSAVYKLNQSYYPLSEYDDAAIKLTVDHSFDLYKGKDINTVIRETNDDIAKAIAKEKSK
jgi:multiple sugar transport system substrate-binding protein